MLQWAFANRVKAGIETLADFRSFLDQSVPTMVCWQPWADMVFPGEVCQATLLSTTRVVIVCPFGYVWYLKEWVIRQTCDGSPFMVPYDMPAEMFSYLSHS